MQVRRVTQPGERGMSCKACGADFEDTAAHRAHHKGDWHRLNLKRKVRGMAPLDEAAFEAMPRKEREAFLEADL